MNEIELERMVLSLVGDGSSYSKMMQMAAQTTMGVARQIDQHSQKIQGLTSKIQGYANTAFNSVQKLKSDLMRVASMGMGSAGASMLPGLLGGAGVVGAAASGGWAISLASQAEQAAISFEVMLGSADSAKKMLKEITDFAAKTPFEMPGLRSAAQMMLNFGVAQNKIMPTLKALGDVAAGDSNKLQGLAYAYSQTQAAGRLMGQDLLQMINWGFNPLQEMARKSGKSMAQLKSEMEAGRISAKMVEEAFISASSEGGKFFNMMERQSTTVNGLWSTLKDTVGIEVTKIGETLVNKLNIRGFLQSLIKGIETVGPMISGGFAKAVDFVVPKVKFLAGVISSTFQAVLPYLTSFGETAYSAFNIASTMAHNVVKSLTPLLSHIPMIVQTVVAFGKSIIEWVTNNTSFLASLAATIITFKSMMFLLGAIPVAIATIGTAFAVLLNPIALVSAAVAGLVYYFVRFTDLGQMIGESLKGIFVTAYDQISLLINLIKNGHMEAAWKVVTTSMALSWATLWAALKTPWITFKEYMKAGWIGMTGFMKLAWFELTLAIKKELNSLIKIYNTLVNKEARISTFATGNPFAERAKIKRETKEGIHGAFKEGTREKSVVSGAVTTAQAAYDAAQAEAKKLQNQKPITLGSTFLGIGMDLAGEAVGMVQGLIPPTEAAAGAAGNQVGQAFNTSMKASMGAIDAVKAGTSQAYNLLSDYRSKMAIKPTTNVTNTAKDGNKFLEMISNGINSLVELNQDKDKNILEIGLSAITGA